VTLVGKCVVVSASGIESEIILLIIMYHEHGVGCYVLVSINDHHMNSTLVIHCRSSTVLNIFWVSCN